MWEDAQTVYFLGVEVYAFGLYCALGAALGLIALAMLLRRHAWKKGTAPLTGVLSILCGFALSRLFFAWMDTNLGAPMPPRGILMITGGGYSMMGALLGACLGGILAARITRQSPARLLDFLAPALLLFVAGERLGEGYIEDFGISRPLQGELLRGTLLAVEGRYDWYLATYLIESFVALLLAVWLLRDESEKRRAGDTFLLFLMVFGSSQMILESLRFDQHMHFSFVGLQQVFAFLMLGAGVVTVALRSIRRRRGLAVAALLAVAAAFGLGLTLEFAIDRTEISRYLLYAAFLAVAAVPVALGIQLRKGGKTTDGKA